MGTLPASSCYRLLPIDNGLSFLCPFCPPASSAVRTCIWSLLSHSHRLCSSSLLHSSHGHLPSISTILRFTEWLINGITEYRSIEHWLVTLGVLLWRFFQVAMCINSPHFIAEWYYIVPNIPQFVGIVLHIEGHRSYFWPLAIMNKAVSIQLAEVCMNLSFHLEVNT